MLSQLYTHCLVSLKTHKRSLLGTLDKGNYVDSVGTTMLNDDFLQTELVIKQIQIQ